MEQCNSVYAGITEELLVLNNGFFILGPLLTLFFHKIYNYDCHCKNTYLPLPVQQLTAGKV